MLVSDLIIAIREQANLETGGIVTDAEFLRLVQSAYGEIYCLLANALKDKSFVSSATLTPSGTSEFTALPADFFRSWGIDEIVSTDEYRRCEPFNMENRNDFSSAYAYSVSMSIFPRISVYHQRIAGNQVWWAPMPTLGKTFRILYCPRCPTVTASTNVDDQNGWISDYIISEVAVRCLQKQEMDFSGPLGRKQMIERQIVDAAAIPDGGRVPTVQDVTGELYGGFPGFPR